MESMRSRRRPQGLELRLLWGDRNVGEYFMRPGGPAAFTVGSAAGVDFAMGARLLGASRFEVVRRDGTGFELRFTERMRGTITRRGEAIDLRRAVSERLAEADGDAFAIALERDDSVSVDLGGVRLEAFFQPVPHPVLAALADRLDYPALNIFLAVFFIGALFVIAAENQAGDADAWADELAGPPAAIVKIGVRLAAAPPNGLAERLREKRLEKKSEAPPAAHEGREGKMGEKNAAAQNRRASPAGNPADPDRSRAAIRGMFSGGAAVALFEGNGLGGELKRAMGNMTGSVYGTARGFEGMGLRDTGPGGGGDARSVGIGRLVTHGRGDGDPKYGIGTPLGPKDNTTIPGRFDEPVVCGGEALSCGLDRELVRQVIHAHRSQIRFCYEDQLTRNPGLAGKVAVRFVIGAAGTVGSSEVAQSTVHSPGLEACVAGRVRSWTFPRPKTGGVVVVTYPFLFKPSGE